MNSIIDEKRGIFNRLSVFTSLKEIELKPINEFNSITSINNDKDVLPFLLDLSTSLVGSDGLQDKLGLFFIQFIEDYNKKSKDLLKDNFIDYNQNQQLSISFLNNGIDIPLSSIDDFNNLKTQKSDPLGELIYDDENDNLLTKIKDAILQPNNPITFSNIKIVYDENNDIINVKPIQQFSIGSFLGTFIDSFSGINKKEFVTDILDNIYGTKSKIQNKTIAELNKENTINEILNKLINEDSIDLSDEDFARINNQSDEIFKGSNQINFGCGSINNVLPFENLKTTAESISNSTNPNEIGGLFNDVFTNSLDENTDQSNITNLKDSFFKKIFNLIKLRILKDMLFSPEKKMLFILASSFDNKDLTNLNSIDYAKSNKNTCDCLVKDVNSNINELIFNLVKTEIIEITKPALKKIITEKINNYKLILTSLTSI
jgi:hypothetical protein